MTLPTRAAPNRGAPWTEKEERLLGTLTDQALAEKLGRTLQGVTWKRLAKGIPAFRPRARVWTAAELAKLGTIADAKLAAELGVSRKHVLQMRQRRVIAPFSGKNTPRKLRGQLKAARHRARKG